MPDERLHPCQYTAVFDWDTLTFKKYLAKVAEQIILCRPDITPTNQETLLWANMPFELNANTKKDVGVILLHGLLDSPLTMRDLSSMFASQNFLVRSVLLPGHGTRPGDLLTVRLEDWLSVTRFVINQTKPLVNKLFLLGFSGGGSLALYETLTHQDIQGVITLAPSFRLRKRTAYFSHWIRRYEQILKKNYWFKTEHPYEFARYNIFPTNLAIQAVRLTQLLTKTFSTRTLQAPWQLIISLDDETVCSQTAMNCFNRFYQKGNELLIYSKKQHKKHADHIEYRTSQYLSENILDFSHIALPICAENIYYGKQAGQNGHKHIFKGAMNKENQKTTPHLNRLSYNPDFAYMVEKILQFIQKYSKNPC